jgi:predicted O-linked N-acetylglucosamine transferase (SPINDLY family)
VQAKSLYDPPTRDAAAAFFAGQGIASDRVQLRGMVDFPIYMNQHNEVDIALDTFPFVGHTTSCHALFMGVPVVTLAGATHRSRMGASLLINIGQAELVARDEDDYVRIAQSLADDLPRLTQLRATLRQRIEQSPVGDARAFTRNLESAYLAMIR